MLSYFGCEHGIHSPFFTCLSYRIKKSKKTTTFKLIKLLKHTQKYVVQKTGFLLDITDWIRVLNQRICHQTTLTWTLRITAFWKICHKDCIYIKGLGICNTRRIYWKKKREELPQYEIDACINRFRYRLLKVIEVAGKHILNIFSRFAVERNVWLLFIMACSSHLLSLLNHKKMSFALNTVQ